MHRRKLAFVMHINKFFRVLGGYIATYKGGFALHVSEKKAILLPYKEMNSKRKKISIIRTFRLKALSITTECGAQYFLQMAALQEFFEGVFLIFGGKKEKLERNLWLTDGDVLRISMSVVIRLNLYMVMRNILKFLKEKVRCYVRQKSKNRSDDRIIA